MSQQLITIAGTTIHQDNSGRYLLNDLHRAAGGHKRHQPSNWLQSNHTKELVKELSSPGISGVEQNQPLKVVNGGNAPGTYVCKELVYSYGMWISPEFQIKVIRAFDILVVEKKDVLVLATENGHLKDMVRSRDEIIQAKNNAIMGLQDRLIGAQGHQIKLLGRVANLEKRQHDRELIQLIERMEAEGKPRDVICIVTGKPSNYVRQRIHLARKAGRLPMVLEGGAQ